MKIKKQDGVTTIGDKAERCTIAYRKLGETVEIAVSYCHPSDKWKAKAGQALVRTKLQLGERIVMPIPTSWEEEDLQQYLQDMLFVKNYV